MKPEELLSHADFVRHLARSLVMDEHSAADITQETWLAALEHPPAMGGSFRAWLSKVTRNFAHKFHRARSRRLERERAAALPEAVHSTEEVVEREELRQRVVEAVLELREPYRTAILFRYYQDLTPREAAERIGIPLATVRTRLRRGLEQLRVRLDKEYGGNRKSWCLALAPLAGMKLAGSAAGASVSVPAVFSGVLAMTTKAKVGLALVLVLCATFAVIQILPDHSEEEYAKPHVAAEENSSEDRIEATVEAIEDSTDSPALDETEVEKAVIPVTGIILSGKVMDSITGEPVQVYDFQLMKYYDTFKRRDVIHETVRNRAGCFSFPLAEAGLYNLAVRSSRYCYKCLDKIQISEKNGLTGLEIMLDSGHSVSGQVVDDATGGPVEGAVVLPRIDLKKSNSIWFLLEYHEYFPHVKTDVRGHFLLKGFERIWKYTIAALHPIYAEGVVEATPGTGEEVVIRLQRGFHFFGTVCDDHGEPLSGVMIRMLAKGIPVPRAVLTDSEGKYMTPPAAPGLVHLYAGPPPGSTEESLNFTGETKSVELVDHDMEVNFGPLPEQVTLRGTLHDSVGEAAPGGEVVLHPGDFNTVDTVIYDIRRKSQCDDAGRFEFRKLALGRYRVELQMPDEVQQRLWGDLVLDTPGTVEKDIHVSGVEISGVVMDGSTGRPLIGKKGHVNASMDLIKFSQPWYAHYTGYLDEEGRFRMKGVPPGVYELQAHIDGFPITFVRGIRVEAGEGIRNLRIVVRKKGRLNLKIIGLGNVDSKDCKLHLERIGGRSMRCRLDTSREYGILELGQSLATGEWSLSLSVQNRGFMQRCFEIFPDETTEMLIDGKELSWHEGFVTLSGSFTRSDGIPVIDAKIYFHALQVPGIDQGKKKLDCKTDAEGRFTVHGFRPGRWSVRPLLADGGQPVPPELTIPPDPQDPFPFHLVLPGGEMRGSLHDSRTGRPANVSDPKWIAYIIDQKTMRIVSQYYSKGNENTFNLAGVPEGEYQLSTVVRGYGNYKSGFISLKEGRILDLGKINLEPCGVLNLDLKDKDGRPISAYRFFCEGTELFGLNCVTLDLGMYCYNNMPLGPTLIKVGSKGFEDQEFLVDFKPHKPVDLQVILQ